MCIRDRRYTIIGVDAYRPPYIPWHLTTQEFFQVAYDHLDEDGVLVINVGRSPANRTLIDDLASTIQTVFPSVHVVDVPASFNSIVYATVQPSTAANMQANLLELATRELGNPGSVHPLLLRSLQVAYGNARPTPTVGVVYTDDWAPIEWVTNNMVLNYVFFGDEEVLH